MYNNGISHKTEARDLDGIYTIMKWLSYIPKVNLIQISLDTFLNTTVLYRFKQKKIEFELTVIIGTP